MTTEPQVELILFPVMCGVVEFGLKKVSPRTPTLHIVKWYAIILE